MAIDEAGNRDLLSSLKVAAPCTVSWESMEGGDRVRHCSQCDKNVYNLTDMTKAEANEFLTLTAQSACVNFYKRADGTVISDNCPVGLRRLRAQYRRTAAAVATVVSLSQGFLLAAFAGDDGKAKTDSASCKSKSESAVSRTAGKVAAPPAGANSVTRGEPLGGAPMPLPDPPAVKSYRDAAKAALIAAMPSKVDFGSAALAVTVDTTGGIKDVHLVNPSPSKDTDQAILAAAKKLKLAALPKDYKQSTLQVYFECREALSTHHPE
jgi:TonB family protein